MHIWVLILNQGTHWAAIGNEIEVSANLNPDKTSVAYVHPSICLILLQARLAYWPTLLFHASKLNTSMPS
jgi:hypothetical protein